MACDRAAVRALGAVVVSLSLGLACSGTTPVEVELEELVPPPLEDAIPYEALGAGTLVFSRGTVSGDGGTYVVDASARRSWGVPRYGLAPAVSPDGQRIAVTRLARHPLQSAWDVHVMDIDGNELANISEVLNQDHSPSWTPDGQVVFYTMARSGHGHDVHRQSAVAKPADRVTITIFGSGGEVRDPLGPISLSAQGQFVVATWSEIYRMEVDGTDLTQIVQSQPFTLLHSPVWSPDGAHIAYLAQVGDAAAPWRWLRVMRMDPDGGNTIELIAICWSPDGTKLAFTRPESESVSHLWVINSDGTGLTQVTSQPGTADKSVTWGR
jgi:Tol biopolymer transport system component